MASDIRLLRVHLSTSKATVKTLDTCDKITINLKT